MVPGGAPFVVSGVDLANNAGPPVRHVPHKGARVSPGGEGFGSPDARAVDGELNGLDAF